MSGLSVCCEGCGKTQTGEDCQTPNPDDIRRFRLSRENSREGSALFMFSPNKNNPNGDSPPIALLRCGHGVCGSCAESQKQFIPKVHKQGIFVCFGCGVRYKSDMFNKKYMRATTSVVSDSEFLGDFQERFFSGERSLDFCEERLDQSTKNFKNEGPWNIEDPSVKQSGSHRESGLLSKRESLVVPTRFTANHELKIPTSFASSRCHSIIEASDDGPSRPQESNQSVNEEIKPRIPEQVTLLDLKIPKMYALGADFDSLGAY